MTTQDYRYEIIVNKSYYKFFDIVQISPWIGSIYKANYNMTYDLKNYEVNFRSVIFGSYFFLSDDRIEHQRTVFTMQDVMAKFGGMCRLVFAFFGFIGLQLNQKMLFAKYIRNMYFKRSKNENLEAIRFRYCDIFSQLLPCFKDSKPQKFYRKSYKKMMVQLDILHVTTALQKIQASISAILDGDQKLM